MDYNYTRFNNLKIFARVFLALAFFFLSGSQVMAQREWTIFNAVGPMSSDGINFDSDGTMWLSSNESGIYKYDGLSFVNYSTKNGLPTNSTSGFAEDKDKNKWFASRAGLLKFNGSSWTVYNMQNSQLPTDYLSSVAIDANGAIWVASMSGVTKIDGNTWTTYTTKNQPGLITNYTGSVYADKDLLYIFYGGNGDGYSTVDKQGTWKKFTQASGVPVYSPRKVIFDPNGDKWFPSYEGLVKLSGTKYTKYRTPNEAEDWEMTTDNVYDVRIDPAGNKWVIGSEGLSKFDGTNWVVYNKANSGIPSENFNAIGMDKNGRLYMDTDAGFGYLGADGQFKRIEIAENSIPYNGVSSLANGKDGSLYLTVARNGLMKFNKTDQWTKYNTTNSPLNENVYSVNRDSKGNLWVPLGWGGVVKFDGATFTKYTTANGLLSDNMSYFGEDANGNIWFGNVYVGLSKFDGTKFTNYNSSNTSGWLGENTPNGMVKTNDPNVIWFPFYNSLVRLSGTTWTSFNKTNTPALPTNSFNGGVTDNDGNVWFWAHNVVIRYTTAGKWESMKANIPGAYIGTIVPEPTGKTVWIGTDAGVTSYNGTTWKTYNLANGLPDNTVRKIIFRGNEKWFLTNGGIARMEGTTITPYTVANSGLPTTTINTMLFDDEGDLWIGTGNSGLVKFGTPAIRLSSDATLSKLTASTGELTPAFTAATTSYAVSVANDVTKIKLTPTVNDAKASVKVAGAAVNSGESSADLPLAEGANPIAVLVTAEDGSTKTYTVTVTRRKNQIIVIDALNSKTYGDAIFDPGAVASSGLKVVYTSSDTTIASVTAAGVRIKKAGTVRIKANQPGNTEFEAATEAEQSLLIMPAVLTVTAKEVAKPYGRVLTNGAVSTGFEADGLVGDDAIESVVFTYGDGAEGAAAIGTYKGQVSPSDASGENFLSSNYNITYKAGDILVNKGKITITAKNAIKTYGQTLTDNSASEEFTVSGLLEGETVGTAAITYGNGANATDAAGTYTGKVGISDVTGGQFSAENYEIEYVAGDIVVEPAALTITAKDVKKYYGQSLTTVEASQEFLADGLQNGETVGAVKITYGTGSAATADAGTYKEQVIAAAAAGGTFTASNYKITYVKGDIHLLAASQVITFNAPEAKTYGALPFTLGGSASSGLDVTYVSSDPSIVSISGKTATILKAGSVTITAKNAGNDNYTAAADVEQNFTVNQASLTITAKNKTKTYGQVLSEATGSKEFTVTGLQNSETIGGVTLTYAEGAAATDAVNVYADQVVASQADGGTFLASNYNITYKAGNIEVKPAALTITANNASKTYGQVLSNATGSEAFTVSGLVNDETVGGVNIAYGTGANASDAVNVYTGQVTPSAATGGSFNKVNYTITYVKGNITVEQAELSVTAKDVEKTYGQALNGSTSSIAFTSSGLMNGETIGSVSIAYGSGALATDAVGTYTGAVVPAAAKGGTFKLANYKVTYLNGDVQVNKASIAVKAAPKTKTYGDADPKLTYTITSGALVGTDAFTGNLIREEGEDVNSYAINQGTLSLNDNYNLSFAGDQLTITKKALTIKADNKSRTYGAANPALTVTYTGLVNGETTLSPAPVVTTAATELSGVGTYDINATATSGNYALTFVKGTLTVSKAALTITADNKEKFQGLALPAFTASYDGFVNGESSSVLTSQASMSTTANTMSPQGTYPISISGATAVNYAITHVPGVLTVKPGYPTSISLAAVTLYENQPAGTLAGTLSSTSDDPTTSFKYELAEGAGDTDNALFTIVDNQLRTKAVLNYEQKPVYQVRLRTIAQNSMLTLDKAFSIELTNVNEQPTLASVADQTICYTPSQQTVSLSGISAGEDAGQTTTLTVSSTNSALFKSLTVTQASNGAAQLRYTAANGAAGSATVTVTVTDDGGTDNGGVNSISRTFDITIHALPVPTITTDKGVVSISKGETLILKAEGGVQYQWSAANGIQGSRNDQYLEVRPDANTTYHVVVTNANGCSESKEISIEVVEDYVTLVGTNLLSPNGDGVNDVFKIDNIDMYPNNEVKIFDRAGRMIYSKRDYSKDGEWTGTLNGSPLAEGTYYYVVDFGAGKPKIKGFITIVRD